MSLGAPTPRILCLAGPQTTDDVGAVARLRGADVTTANTVAEALALLQAGSFHVVVAALGTHGANLLFNTDGSAALLQAAAACASPPCRAVVFSHTACREEWKRDACLDAGADAVVCTREELDAALESGLLAEDVAVIIDAGGGDGSSAAVTADAAAAEEEDAWESLPAATDFEDDDEEGDDGEEEKEGPEEPTAYDPIARWSVREARLGATALPGSRLLQAVLSSSARQRARFEQQLALLPRPLTVARGSPAKAASGKRVVRFTVVSDTHDQHERVVLPPSGDMLLHCGDCVGNYGDHDLKQSFRSFVAWLAAQAARYQHVVFIAGNHDTLLDDDCGGGGGDRGWARAHMAAHLPANVTYLQDSGVKVLGVRLWGSPMTPCRVESQGKRFYSNGFERTNAHREARWEGVPEGTDVLLTHAPPGGGRRALGLTARVTAHGDPLLAAR
jgi:hypothetical protein